MTCKEALHAWREKTAGQAPHARVYFFHAHIYYDSARQEEKLKMHTIIKEMQDEFAADDHVGVHTLQDKPVGPHPMANLEVLFTRERYTAMMNYLTYALPTTFSALIHQLTADQVGDHTKRAVWLGKQGTIKPELLEKMDRDAAARGLSEEDIIWAVHAH